MKTYLKPGGIIAVLAVVLIIAGCSDQQKSPVSVTNLSNDGSMNINCEPLPGCPPVVYDLTACQTIPVGNVTVWNDKTTLYVEYNTDAPWFLTEVHLYISTAPFTSRLAPGKAPYKSGDISYASTYTFTIPLQWECDVTIYLQAHAAVVKKVDGMVVEEETAYGGDITKPRGAWYGNIAFTICCEEEPPPECQEETAWGGNTEGGGNAWWYYYENDGQAQTIWAGQTIDVGTVKYENGFIDITLTGGWELQDVSEPVKIQGYTDDTLPTGRPSAGLFTTYKGDLLTVEVPYYTYYAIHLDVQLCE